MMGPMGERTSATKPPTVPTIPAKFKAGLISLDKFVVTLLCLLFVSIILKYLIVNKFYEKTS
jgi:hypothetical protein